MCVEPSVIVKQHQHMLACECDNECDNLFGKQTKKLFIQTQYD